MRKYILYLCITVQALFASCIREDISGNTPESNFESLWKIIDEQYCFLEYKHEEYGLDWDEVHTRYAQRITSDMTWENLYEVLSDMVNELRDGHVNRMSTCPVPSAHRNTAHGLTPSPIISVTASRAIT